MPSMALLPGWEAALGIATPENELLCRQIKKMEADYVR